MLVQRRRSNAEEMKGPSYGISSLQGDGGRGETSHVAPAPGKRRACSFVLKHAIYNQ